MRISDWSSDVCSSDLAVFRAQVLVLAVVVLVGLHHPHRRVAQVVERAVVAAAAEAVEAVDHHHVEVGHVQVGHAVDVAGQVARGRVDLAAGEAAGTSFRSDEHTSELQSLMRISYAFFCLKKTNNDGRVYTRRGT